MTALTHSHLMLCSGGPDCVLPIHSCEPPERRWVHNGPADDHEVRPHYNGFGWWECDAKVGKAECGVKVKREAA